ncbi:fimbrial protein [Enterobacter sp. KBR-315C3_2022]|uniref:fimbrial protein n=1 Tax=Enterobacter sp. KBR-315C3_2022 TaxID=3242494 RepID=UPI003526F6AB
MIKNILSIGLLSLGIVPSLTFAETHVTVKGGDVEFRGAVVNAACVVDVGSEDLTVQMGEIRTDEFHGLGSWTDPQAFTLELKDCDSTVSQDVGVTFRGQTDKKDPGVLAVIDGAQSAQGVGLGLFDSQGNQIIPNERPLTFTPIQDGTTSLHFTARYRATSNEVIAGDANTETWFTLTYL